MDQNIENVNEGNKQSRQEEKKGGDYWRHTGAFRRGWRDPQVKGVSNRNWLSNQTRNLLLLVGAWGGVVFICAGVAHPTLYFNLATVLWKLENPKEGGKVSSPFQAGREVLHYQFLSKSILSLAKCKPGLTIWTQNVVLNQYLASFCICGVFPYESIESVEKSIGKSARISIHKPILFSRTLT